MQIVEFERDFGVFGEVMVLYVYNVVDLVVVLFSIDIIMCNVSLLVVLVVVKMQLLLFMFVEVEDQWFVLEFDDIFISSVILVVDLLCLCFIDFMVCVVFVMDIVIVCE